MRLSIEEYAKKKKMSIEMVHAKLKAGKLNFITENGKQYIVSNEEETTPQTPPAPAQKTKITVATLIELYKRENRALKERVHYLEAKIDKLIDDKEQLLKEERERIEKVYAQKDEQLKRVLELINTKLQLEQQSRQPQEEIEALPQKQQPKLIELKEYLKSLDLEPHEKKVIKKRFNEAKGSDIRLHLQNGKIFLDFSKYDYSDLLNL